MIFVIKLYFDWLLLHIKTGFVLQGHMHGLFLLIPAACVQLLLAETRPCAVSIRV